MQHPNLACGHAFRSPSSATPAAARRRHLWLAGLAAALAAACGGGGGDSTDGGSGGPAPTPAPTLEAQVVGDWHATAVEAFRRYDERARADTADTLAPLVDSDEQRLATMVAVSFHDALNAVDRRYAPAVADLRDATADPGAALASAARDTLLAVLPTESEYIQQRYDAALGARPAGAARDAGVALGQQVAAAVVAARQNDGSRASGTPVYSSNAPGEYRFTRCPQDAGQTNFSACGPIKSNWPNVRLWALPSLDNFRVPNPYGVAGTDRLAVLAAAVQSPGYTVDFDEVKFKGVAGGQNTRTADESVVAMFWEEASHRAWARLAETVAQQKGLDAWQRARTHAQLQLAIADTWIAVYAEKYRFGMWRPVSGIHYADLDGNPDTALFNCPPTNVFCWDRFGRSTPPTQEYPSAHAALGGAAERVLAAVAGSDELSFSMNASQGTNPSLVLTAEQRVRSYTRLSQAAEENAASRVFIGFHFRESTRAGLDQGRRIGEHVATNTLAPR